MRRRLLLAAGVIASLGLLGALAFEPLARERAEERARALGLSVAIESVRPRWGGFELSGVRLGLAGSPVVTAVLERVLVDIGVRLRPTAVTAQGGTVVVSGSPAEVLAALRAWRDRRTPEREPSSQAASGTPLEAHGLVARWESNDFSLSAEGIGARRAGGAGWELGATEVHGRHRGVELSGSGVLFGIGRSVEGVRAVTEVRAKRVDATVDLARAGEWIAWDRADTAGAGSASASAAGEPAAARDARAAEPERDALDGAPATAQEHARGEPSQVRATGGFGLAALHAGLQRVATLASRHLATEARIALSGIRLHLRHGDEVLNFGPSGLQVVREAEALRARFTPESGATGPASLALEIEVAARGGPVTFHVDGGPVALSVLGVQEGDFGLIGVERTMFEARGRLVLGNPAGEAQVSGNGRLQGLGLRHDALAKNAVTGIDLGWDLTGKGALDGTRLEIGSLSVRLGQVTGALSGRLARESGGTTAQLTVELPLAACQDLLLAVPKELVPVADGMRMTGTFSLRGSVDVDSRRLLDARVDLDVRNACKIDAFDPALAPERFFEQFRRSVRSGDGALVEVLSGPGTPDWVPYPMISPNLVTAVLVCEDGHFFRHDGFDIKALGKSIRENLVAGRFVRGASTLSMQLAKNLYLTSDKTVSRKLQEALLTLLLEQRLSKHELIELYLNIVEYAPGVYGAAAAADHYFGTTPAELSLGQAFYMASVLPNPKRQYFTRDGRVSSRWSDYLRTLMGVAHRIGRIGDDELAAGLNEQVVFGMRKPLTRSSHVAEDESEAGEAATRGDKDGKALEARGKGESSAPGMPTIPSSKIPDKERPASGPAPKRGAPAKVPATSPAKKRRDPARTRSGAAGRG